MNDYYVYEHIRLDNNTCFYIGKGRGKRANCKTRNEHHDRIVKKYGMRVNVVSDGLSEAEAFKIEEQLISYYVFVLGYGIDIIGYNNNKNEPGHLTNHTFGGDGSKGMVHSKEWCVQHSVDMIGKNNPMYGVNFWDSYSEKKKQEILHKISNASKGKNNPMYGISPKERMDEKTYNIWYKKNRQRLKNQCGKNNPNYGNKTLHDKVKDNPELRIKYYSRPGAQNGRARGIKLFDSNYVYLKEFKTIGDGCQWLKDVYGFTAKIDSIRSNLSIAIKNKTMYKGFYGEFI